MNLLNSDKMHLSIKNILYGIEPLFSCQFAYQHDIHSITLRTYSPSHTTMKEKLFISNTTFGPVTFLLLEHSGFLAVLRANEFYGFTFCIDPKTF